MSAARFRPAWSFWTVDEVLSRRGMPVGSTAWIRVPDSAPALPLPARAAPPCEGGVLRCDRLLAAGAVERVMEIDGMPLVAAQRLSCTHEPFAAASVGLVRISGAIDSVEELSGGVLVLLDLAVEMEREPRYVASLQVAATFGAHVRQPPA